ncbi:DUF4245 domain-containing protein [Paramicrobacterium chengjingii]|uniref:DUF4245 domain-containing protein n=1 Tax=Paramicrobacterium chengjingii TaxID=2769067 RepID=A0ABX6YLD5_9MICO|nr:DUF4245 domain-containing protein [Microbacterium chengjingii]QPZ39558.1 DUF4245 domain-containing protein [Microbacterium chengjingii]
MTRQQKPPRVVAELGRPETPEETAARKAEDSRNYRMRKTVSNLVYALLATLAIVLIIVLIVPRSNTSLLKNVDFHSAAEDAQASRDEVIIDPQLPDGWTSNKAKLSSVRTPQISLWYIGLLTPDEQFIGIKQGFDANATWQSQQLEGALADTTVTIEGITWTVYDNRDGSGPSDPGNIEYALATESGSSTILIYGTAKTDDIRTVAEAIAEQVKANALK